MADLLSTLLDRPCRLVTTAAEHRRPTEDGCAEIAFADGYPLLLISDSSLTELQPASAKRCRWIDSGRTS